MSIEVADPSTLETPPVVVTTDHGSLEARKAFNAALAIAQGGFLPIVKNRSVTIKPRDSAAYSFKYADLQEIQAKTRPALSTNGLSTTSQMLPGEDGVNLVVILMHAEGFERVSEVFIKYGEEIKQFGAKLKYMRRYMVQGLLDVDADDDLDENGQDGGVGGEGGGVATDATAAKAPAPRGPARKTPAAPPAASPAVGGDLRPEPPDEAVVKAQAATRTANAAEARERVVEKAFANAPHSQSAARDSASAQAAAPTIKPEDNPAAGADEAAAVADPEETGELCEPGEIAFLLKRCKNRGGDMTAVLHELGLSFLNADTLANLTKRQWTRIKEKV